MSLVAIIPARGGSKRIPRKNIRLFNGKPMIFYSIQAALDAGIFSKVLVSTDDEEIMKIAKDSGAEVPFIRPKELADDFAATAPVIAHAIGWLRENKLEVTGACCIYPTAPFISKTDILKAFELFNSGQWDYVFPATTFAYPIFRSFEKNGDDGISMFFPENFNKRSQDLPEAYHDAGQFYFGKSEAWLEERPIFDKNSTFIQLPRWRVQDIDTSEDWERAERILRSII